MLNNINSKNFAISKTIERVVKDGLCTGCGTCSAFCPNNAIKIDIRKDEGIYLPIVETGRCSGCGLCYKVCPGCKVDFKQLNLEIFGKEPENMLIGNYIDCYMGYASKFNIRFQSASGGLITAILIFALDEGIIDGALVTRMKKCEPFEPEPFIAYTKEEIIEASKSKYCPVPANIAIREILNSTKGKKFAVVGLPCHMHGIKKAEQIFDELEKKVTLHLGIMCSHTLTFRGTNFILSDLFREDKENIRSISYRGNGWPGYLSIDTGSGKKSIPFSKMARLHLLHYFTPSRCLLCCDQNCELADLSFGDAWLPNIKDKDNIGSSIIVVRTDKGEQIINKTSLHGDISLKKVSPIDVIQSQKGELYFKKRTINANFLFKKKKPIYTSCLLKPQIRDYILSGIINFHVYISSKDYLKLIIKPLFQLEVYAGKTLIEIKNKIKKI